MEGDDESCRCPSKGEQQNRVVDHNNNVDELRRCQMIDLRRELHQRRQKTQSIGHQQPQINTVRLYNQAKASSELKEQQSIRTNKTANSISLVQNVPISQCLVELRLRSSRSLKICSSSAAATAADGAAAWTARKDPQDSQEEPKFEQQMAASIKQIESGCSKTLRQINIVGQLNHSACKGTLMMVNNMITLTIMSLLFLLVAISEKSSLGADGLALWPFNGPPSLFQSNSSLASVGRHLQTSKRTARDSGLASGRPKETAGGGGDDDEQAQFIQPPQPMPVSKQFHYFWNHDQIEPKTLSQETQKILSEAQQQTDQMLLNSMVAARSPRAHVQQAAPASSPTQVNPHISNRQDMPAGSFTQQPTGNSIGATQQASGPVTSDQEQQVASGSEHQMSVVVSPAVQQQLTSMVLQMQRQQDMSMMMQPKFGFAPLAALAGQMQPAARRNSMPAMMNPMSRLWMAAGSNQHPVIAVPPSPMGPLTAAESVHSAAMSSPFGAPGVMQARASMAGVPIYGPFMVAPSIGRSPFMPPHFMNQPMPAPTTPTSSSNSGSSSAKQSTSKLASSFLGRRRSWPLFSLGGSSSSSNSDKSSNINSAASHVRPTVALPPAAAAARALAMSLPPESLALIDMASNQLASAILSQMQARSAAAAASNQHQAMATSVFADESMSGDQMQSSGSIPSIQFVSARHNNANNHNNAQIPEQSFSLDNANFNAKSSANLQPPYLLQSSGGAPSPSLSPAALNLASSFLTYPSQNFELYSSLLGSSGAQNGTIPFGSRLKRRHLSTNAPQRPLDTFERKRTLHNQAPYTVRSIQPSTKLASGEQMADETELRPTHVAFKNETIDKRQSRSMSDQKAALAKSKIVKKEPTSMSEGLSLKKHQQKKASEAQNMRQLFMIVATESPVPGAKTNQRPTTSLQPATQPKQLQEIHLDAQTLGNLFETDESAQPGQVRRLKRSIKVFNNVGKQSSGWKSMDSKEEVSKLNDDVKSMVGEFESKRSTATATATSTTTSGNNGWLASPSSSSSVSTSSWLPKPTKTSPAVATVAPMLKRQAELSISPGETSSKQTTEQDAQPKPAVDNHRQDRSLKIKRISASSASVMHHSAKSSSDPTGGKRSAMRVMNASSFVPMPSANEKTSDSGSQTSASESASDSNSPSSSQQAGSSSSSSQTPAPDVMMASLSESARVVNYFANVENDPVTSTTSRPQVTTNNQQTGPSSSSSGSGQPQINVGFPPPAKTNSNQAVMSLAPSTMSSQQQQNSNNNNNMVSGRLNDTQQMQNNQQASGNSATYGPRSSTSGIGSGAGNINDFPTGIQQQQQMAIRQQTPSRPQFQLNVGNADISSAATGPQAFAVKSIAIPTSASFVRQQTEASSPISIKLQSPFSANLLTTLLGLDPTQRSSSPSGTIVPNIASSLNANGANRNSQHHRSSSSSASSTINKQQQPSSSSSAPSLASSPSSLSQMERSPSADQSNNFNEELLPPLQQQFMMNDNNQQRQQQQQQQMQYGMQQADSSLGNNQDLTNGNQMGNNEVANQMAAGLPPGFSDNNFGTRNSAQQQQQQQQLDNLSDQQQGLELARYNQQQVNQLAQQHLFGSSPFNATGGPDQFAVSADMSPPPPIPQETSNLYGGNGAPSGSQQQQSFAFSTSSPSLQLANTQQTPGQFHQQQADTSQMLGSPTSGLNWHQLQALGAAVSNYNQQRFNQLEDAMRLESLQPQQSAGGHRGGFDRTSMFGHQQQEPMATTSLAPPPPPPPSSHHHHHHSHQPFGAVDEEAAAGAAAAAGIPTYPNAAQLMAMQAHAHHLPAQTGAMLMASTENREADDSDSEPKPAKKKNKKKGGSKQAVSHHYHFNSLGSPFEDSLTDGQTNPMSPLDLVAGIQASEQAQANKEAAKQKAKKQQEEEEQQEKEAEKPKKKGFLRRFSIKNFFKRFKKDKKKENQSQASEDQNESSNSSSQSGSSDQ